MHLLPPQRARAPKPRFYFHLQNDFETLLDHEGTDCADVAAARREASLSAREMLAERIRFEKDDLPDCIIITDANGMELGTVTLREVVPKKLLGH